MTYKSHLINFCYLPYLHLNFPTDTIVFYTPFLDLKAYHSSTFLRLYLSTYFTLHHTTICPHCEKKTYKKQKRP